MVGVLLLEGEEVLQACEEEEEEEEEEAWISVSDEEVVVGDLVWGEVEVLCFGL